MNVCAICLNNLKNNLNITPCGHKYHKKCIERWHNTGKTTCPQCRKRTRNNTKKTTRNVVIETVLENIDTGNLRNSLKTLMKNIGKLNSPSDVQRMNGYMNILFNRQRTRPLRIPTNIPEYNKIMSIKNSILELNLNNNEKILIKRFSNQVKEYMTYEELFALE